MKKLIQKLSVFLFAAFLVCSAGHVVKAESECVYKGEIYYSIKGNLYKLNPSTKSTKLVKSFSNAFSLSSFNISGGKMYLTIDAWMMTGAEDYHIYSLDLKSKETKELANGENCLLEGKYIYYIETAGVDEVTGISRMKKDGSGKEKLYSGVPYFLTLYKNRLYFCESGKIKSMKLNGKGVRTEVSGNISYDNFIGIDNNYLYYIEGDYINGQNVYRSRIGSSSKKLVASNVNDADVQNNVLYYVRRSNNSYPGKGDVYKKNLKSGKTSKIYSGSGVSYIECCGNWLYLIKNLKMSSSSNTQDFVITTSGKKVKDLQKYFVS